MINRVPGMMGPPPGMEWVEVEVPYWANRNEEELDLDPQYSGAMPCWAIWDWLELKVPDLHDDVESGCSWYRGLKMDKFIFCFRDPRIAALFALTFT